MPFRSAVCGAGFTHLTLVSLATDFFFAPYLSASSNLEAKSFKGWACPGSVPEVAGQELGDGDTPPGALCWLRPSAPAQVLCSPDYHPRSDDT